MKWVREGDNCDPGWNIYFDWSNIVLCKVTVNLRDAQCVSWRFRCRWYNTVSRRWSWYCSSNTYYWNLIDAWLFDRSCVIISKVDWEDGILRPERINPKTLVKRTMW